MYFQYDTNGFPLGFIWNDTQYLYMTNQMGDVISITDTNGEIVGNYEYDAWGAVGSIYTPNDSEIEITLANINPLRYRGYYYDVETGYYYLQSRYYDTSICRFINADISEIAQRYKDIYTGINIFSYCNNNPINLEDPNGYYSYSSLGKNGIKLLNKQLQKNINEMRQHNYKGFSLYGGKIYCVSAVHYTAYWYGTTLRYDVVTYESTAKTWYSYMDSFKNAAKKIGVASSIISSGYAALAKYVLKLSSSKIATVLSILGITIEILIEIKQGVLDKIEKNIRHKSKNYTYRFNLYVVNIVNGTFGNNSKTVLYTYTSGVAAII